jgi:hypothetical protein
MGASETTKPWVDTPNYIESMNELNEIEKSVKSVMKRGIEAEIQKLVNFLKKLLSMLGGSYPAPARQPDPESKPVQKQDVILAGIRRDQRRQNSWLNLNGDNKPLKDSW